MPTAVEDMMEAVTNGVLRALDAIRAKQKTNDLADVTGGLVRSGFFVDIHIRAGGYPPALFEAQIPLNPQPLPPAKE